MYRSLEEAARAAEGATRRQQALRAENEALRAALEDQWSESHFEHCRRDWPHDGICHWPPPDVLGWR